MVAFVLMPVKTVIQVFPIPGYPKFTDQVQHFFSKVLRWDDSMNNFRLKTAVEFPVLAKPGKQSAKSRQLWIARHRL